MDTMTVDYSITLEQMMAAGNYDKVNHHINGRQFPLSDTGKVAFEPKVFQFDHSISSEDAIREMEKDGFRPAKIEELLTYDALLSRDQQEYPICGLGSVVEINGNRHVPCLSADGWGRYCELSWFDSNWSENCYFLGVRE